MNGLSKKYACLDILDDSYVVDIIPGLTADEFA